jgi:hypothetical protein
MQWVFKSPLNTIQFNVKVLELLNPGMGSGIYPYVLAVALLSPSQTVKAQ